MLVEADDNGNKFFVVITGRLNILRTSGDTEEIVAVDEPGMFTGELNMLSGRRGLVRIRAGEPSEVIEIGVQVISCRRLLEAISCQGGKVLLQVT